MECRCVLTFTRRNREIYGQLRKGKRHMHTVCWPTIMQEGACYECDIKYKGLNCGLIINC